MITNRKLYAIRIFLVFCLFISATSVAAQKQNKILEIFDEDGFPFLRPITIRLKTEKEDKEIDVKVNQNLDPVAIIKVLSGKTLVLETINGTTVTIPGETMLGMDITDLTETYRVMEINSLKEVIIKELEAYTGSVIADGMTGRMQALTVGTEFSIGLTNDKLRVKLSDGKLNLKHLTKREIKDDNVIGNDSTRMIFIRNDRQLEVKHGSYPTFKEESLLANDKEIKKFLRKPFKNQRKLLISSGENAKEAFKYVINQDSTELALLSFDKAVENDELKIDLIIQSAFLFADYYLFSDNPEKSKNWLDVGLHFSKDFYEIKFGKKFYSPDEEFLNINILDSNSEIDKALKKKFRYEMITAYEFTTWGYDIKLKLNGCLENSDENPGKFRSYANNLITAIEKDN